MAVRIVFSDIDGTLLTDDKRVTERTAYAVRALVKKGIRFVPVSARMPEAIAPILREIGIVAPIIAYSGAFVLTEAGEELASVRMAEADTRAALGVLAPYGTAVTVNYYAGHRWLVPVLDAQVQHEMDITQARAEVADLEAALAGGTLSHKLLVMCAPKDCARLREELVAALPALCVVRSAPHLIEIMEKTVSKARGIDVLLAHYGLARGSAIAFGDNYNDLEMLDAIPESVVMGNAPEAIRARARHVTATNEADGIYAYLVRRGILEAQP